jgi:hypothetical protein
VADPLFQLATDVERALDRFGAPRRDAGASLAWAVFNLRAARVGLRLVEQLGAGRYAQLKAVIPEEWDAIEIAAMSLGFGDTVTALDLCANAVYLAVGGPPAKDGRYKDVSHWSEGKLAGLPSSLRVWVSNLVAADDYCLLLTCRDAITHRTLSRTIALSVGSAPSRNALRISTSSLDPGGPRVLGSLDELIPRFVAFGEQQYALCCDAILETYGS